MTTPHDIIATAVREGRKALFEHEAKTLVHAAGIIVPRGVVVAPEDDEAIVAAGEKLGFPLVLKAIAPGVVHKTEAGAVMVNITGRPALSDAVQSMKRMVTAAAPGVQIRAFLIEKMLPLGLELLIGVLRDRQFGPSVSLGLGGVWVEAIRDVAFGILPMSREEMAEMIDRTRASIFLKGFRGTPPFDQEAVHLIIARLSKLLDDHPEISELELNPVRVYEHGAAALDARMILA